MKRFSKLITLLIVLLLAISMMPAMPVVAAHSTEPAFLRQEQASLATVDCKKPPTARVTLKLNLLERKWWGNFNVPYGTEVFVQGDCGVLRGTVDHYSSVKFSVWPYQSLRVIAVTGYLPYGSNFYPWMYAGSKGATVLIKVRK